MLTSLADVAPEPSGTQVGVYVAVAGLCCLLVIAAIALIVVVLVRRRRRSGPPAS
jgi:hypothetical protein